MCGVYKNPPLEVLLSMDHRKDGIARFSHSLLNFSDTFPALQITLVLFCIRTCSEQVLGIAEVEDTQKSVEMQIRREKERVPPAPPFQNLAFKFGKLWQYICQQVVTLWYYTVTIPIPGFLISSPDLTPVTRH